MENQETRPELDPPLAQKNTDIASTSGHKRKHVESNNPLDLSFFKKTEPLLVKKAHEISSNSLEQAG